jgi:hypothetical protein
MTEGRGDSGDHDESIGQQSQGGPRADIAGERPTLSEFRRRIDSFWGDSRTRELEQAYPQISVERASLPPASVLSSTHQDALAILESRPDHAAFRLRKSLTIRDGTIVAISGDESPLASDEDVLAVTTTTTVMDSNSVVVDTTILVFEREA